MSSASERNKEPILNVLKTLFSEESRGNVLEIASGSDTHVLHFAKYFRNIMWQPTDVDLRWLGNLTENATRNGLSNIRPPLRVDVSKPVTEWPPEVTTHPYDIVLCTNMIHITPFTCTEGLFTAAGQLLKDSGILVTYGPYAVNGVLTPQSNVDFDKSLKLRNPSWGVRDIVELQKLASKNNLKLCEMFEMPANNKTLVFRKELTFHN